MINVDQICKFVLVVSVSSLYLLFLIYPENIFIRYFLLDLPILNAADLIMSYYAVYLLMICMMKFQ